MAERKATNKYIPPDFDPKKHSSVNKYRNSHPLRKRASKLKTEGSLVIRFELPYDGICTNCETNIARSTRFNARKYQKDGESYLSTPIYTFEMKCYECSGKIVIKTDPQHATYVCEQGLKWKTQPLLNVQASSSLSGDSNTTTIDEQQEMYIIGDEDFANKDAMDKMQHEQEDLEKSEHAIPILQSIIKMNQIRSGNDFECNLRLRNAHRKLRQSEKKACEELSKRVGAFYVNENTLKSVLPEESLEDGIIAKQEISSRHVNKSNTLQGRNAQDDSIFSTRSSNSPVHHHNSTMKSMLKRIHQPGVVQSLAQELKKRKYNSHATSGHAENDDHSSNHQAPLDLNVQMPPKSKRNHSQQQQQNIALSGLRNMYASDSD
ncbi:hypothetical protein FDP41_008892 [Naegleria fowleri]|uniref:Splicing factor YJU2 n=1 Tax=Naegleria fowleri TaxID=5763 RepID=A0A6A5AYW9_NAEFO|nr:uncharacterized protein FDP41_008892 [Naegleria fowleri]KAF0972643.1 hypothetical protein FDP41_008892 [Naegleria fowleri]